MPTDDPGSLSEPNAPTGVTVAVPKRSISRRSLLTAGLGVGAALLLPRQAWGAGMMHGSSSMSGDVVRPAVFPPKPAPLMQPEVRRATAGVLSTTLAVRYAYLDIAGYRLHYRTYE